MWWDDTLLLTLDVVGPLSPMTTSTLPSIIFLTLEPLPIARLFVDLIHIIDHIVKNNVFGFDGELFLQAFGTAMDTHMTPFLAILSMTWLEEAPSSSLGSFGSGSWMTFYYSGQTQYMNWATPSSTLTLFIPLSNSLDILHLSSFLFQTLTSV